MRTVEDILKEFERDFENEKLGNDTLEIKYLKSIIPACLKEDISEDQKDRYVDLESTLRGRIEKRDDTPKKLDDKIVQLQQDIKRGFRVMRLSDGTEFAMKFPTIVDDEVIEGVCSKLYNKLIIDSEWLTEKEILDALDARGVFTKEDEDRLDRLAEDYKELGFKTNSEYTREKPSQKRIEQYRKEMDEIRDAFNKLNMTKVRHTSNSIEAKVEERRLREKLVRCTYKVDTTGEEPKLLDLFWGNVQDLEDPSVKPQVVEVYNLAQSYWSGLDTSIIEGSPSDKSEGEETSEN